MELHRFRFKVFNWMLALLTIQGGFAARDIFRSGLEDAGRQYACPGEVVNYTCTVVDPTSPPIASSFWRGTAFNCPGSFNGITLGHSLFNTSGGASGTCNSGGLIAESVSVVDNCFTSRLMLTVSSALNGTTVECTLSGVRVVGSRTLLIAAYPVTPVTPTVTFPFPGQQFTITWDEPPLSMGGRVDAYFVNISGPDDLCGNVNTLQRYVSRTRSYSCSGWTPAGQNYTFTVQAANCGGDLRGPASDPVTVYLRAPNPPTLTATPLYDSSGVLLQIESQATERSPVTIADGVDSSPTEYFFFYNGSPIPMSTGSTPQCTNSLCQHTFRVTSSQVQQYTVSVAARNVVGVGTASTPVSVDSTNTVFNVTVDVGVCEVTCQFLNGPATSATCTVQYGTDPTYVNLPYTDSSIGTNVNSVTVPLSTPLQASTLYYYVVSSMGIRVQGTFRTGCILADLGVMDTTPDERCIGLLQNSAQVTGGVMCYSGVTPGSLTVYVCNSTHHLEGPRFRECQSNGNWSGTVPHCVADPQPTNPEPDISTGQEPATAGLSAGIVVGISITIFLMSFSAGVLLAALTTYCCMRSTVKSSGKPHLTPSEDPQPAPVYDEVGAGKLEVKENVAYGPVDTLEMKQNPSYGPVGH